ncbi:MAG: ABC transporter permease, partial [Ignavibacteriaceae bacterium]
MLKNYFKIALRKIARQKMNTFITVGGLAIGIASAVFIFTFILNELSYDRFNKNQENIFRVITGNVGESDAWAGTPAPLGPTLINSLPEVKEFVRMNLIESFVRVDNKSFHEKKVLCADPSLFKVFSFQVIEGNVNNLLSDPNSVVISESAAKKYFGDKSPLG